MRRIWTKELAEQVIKKYSSIKELAENDQSAYQAILKYGWINDFSQLQRKQTWKDINDLEEIKAIALKCKNKSSFRIHYLSYYKAAKNFGILDSLIYSSEINIDTNACKWVIYVYEINKSAYIGLTIDLKRRDYEHRARKRDSLYKWCQKNNIILEKNSYIVKYSELTAEEAQIQEDLVKKEYKANGWDIINQNKTGKGSSSLGSLIIKWNEETCYKEAQKYTFYKDFHKKSPRAYTIAVKNNWINNYTWLIKTSEHLKKAVLQFDLNNNFIAEYSCTSEIEKLLGFNRSTIRHVCNPNKIRQKTAYGFIWRYKENC